MNKTIEYAFLKLRMLNLVVHINSQLLRKVCIFRDHIYDLKLPEMFRFDVESPKFGSPYFILYTRAPTAIDEAVNHLGLGRIDTELYNHDNT